MKRNAILFSTLAIINLINCGALETQGLFTTSNSSSESGVGGSSTGNSMTTTSGGGASCQSKVTCQSIGAECGIINDDGCGKPMNCGNNCNFPLTCGGGSLGQFKCGCTPKTCVDLEKNCGDIDNGCGKSINCGTCDKNRYQHDCGTAPIVADGPDGGPTILLPPTPNVCGGGCAHVGVSQSNNFPCYLMKGHTKPVHCDQNIMPTMPQSPGTDCLLIDNVFNVWCCSE